MNGLDRKAMRARLAEQRATLKAERRVHRARVKAQVASARSRLREARRAQGHTSEEDRKRRRRWILFWILLLLLLLLLSQCDCDEPAAAPLPTPDAALNGGSGAPADAQIPDAAPPPKRRRKRPRTRIKGRDRPAMEAPRPEPPVWLAQFRLQVAARSARLAACFDGADHPGALKWTAAVNARSGAVSDQSLEPALEGSVLPRKRRQCLTRVLSDPPYRLPEGADQGPPARVSIIIEF